MKLGPRKYIVNGRTYTFIRVRGEGKFVKGYCKSVGKWAYLFDDYIQFEGEKIQIAVKI